LCQDRLGTNIGNVEKGDACFAGPTDTPPTTTLDAAVARWEVVEAAAGGPQAVSVVAQTLIAEGGQTELEVAAKLMAKPGVGNALPADSLHAVSHALLKRGCVKLIAWLVCSVREGDEAVGLALQTELLETAQPRTAERLAASLGIQNDDLPTGYNSHKSARSSLRTGASGGDAEGGVVVAVEPALPWLCVSDDMVVALVRTATDCEAAVRELISDVYAASTHDGEGGGGGGGGGRGMLGLDTEWGDSSPSPSAPDLGGGDGEVGAGGKKRPTSVLLQLSSARHCVLVSSH
jgi:hypothetical protein